MKYLKFILISLLFLTACGKKVYEVEETEDFTITNDTIEVFDTVYLNDLIKKNNSEAEIISENIQIDTEKIGTKYYKLTYELDNKTYVFKFPVHIVDTEAPIVFSGTNKTVVKGYEGDLCNIITYGDNYDGILNCSITGEYDIYKPGTYKLKYNISDSSNNTKEVNVTLNVVEKTNSSNSKPSNKKTFFSDVISNYKTSDNEIGIDVSKWQGDIDFEKVKNAGATFVMMRIGVQGSTERNLSVDKYYLQNIENAKKAGLKVGVYLYSIALDVNEAISQAKWVVETLNGETLDLPIVFDWENWSKWNTYKISFHDINNIADSFINEVKNSGYDGMLYSSKFYLETIWKNKNDNPVWLAHYIEKTSYTGKYMMWQLCNNGRIDGINGDVDIDILYN